MMLDDRMFYFASAATIGQFLEVLQKELRYQKDKRWEESG
jgi:hypothetical protein